MAMAPTCVCGHRASDHRKQMNIRTWCAYEAEPVTMPQKLEPARCECLMYRPNENGRDSSE